MKRIWNDICNADSSFRQSKEKEFPAGAGALEMETESLSLLRTIYQLWIPWNPLPSGGTLSFGNQDKKYTWAHGI